MARICVLHGPNLNLLGTREPEVYGVDDLETINARLRTLAQGVKHELEATQSNSEARLIELVHQAKAREVSFIILNPAAFTHSSIALRDALLAVSIPFIEVHLSNVFSRETFRHHSYFSDIAVGVIVGLGPLGYELALSAAVYHLSHSDVQSGSLGLTRTG